MANAINVAELRYLTIINTPDYPEPAWKHNPDMSAVAGVAHRYWKWDGVAERPIEMTQGERDAVDAALLTSTLDAAAAELDNANAVIRAMAQLMVREFNDHSDTTNEILDAVAAATSLATFKTEVALISARTMQQFRTAMRGLLGS